MFPTPSPISPPQPEAPDAAVAAAFCTTRRQLVYYVAYPEQVGLAQIAAAAAPGAPVRLVVDETRPRMARGPLDIGPAQRDFGFAPQVDHREGIRRMVAAAVRRGA